MRGVVVVWVALVGLASFSCKEDAVTPPVEPPGRQHDIPWASLADSPWPMGHHDPQSTGRSPYVAGPEGTLVWKKEGLAVFSGIILDTDGTLYYQSADSSLGYGLYALNPDGTLKWKSNVWKPAFGQFSKNFTHPVLAVDGTIYLIAVDGNLYAFKRDGSLKWMVTADSPIRVRGLNIGLDGTLYFVSNSGVLYALNPDGSVRWQKSVDDEFWGGETGPSIVFSPDGKTLYVGGKRKGLYAVDIEGEIKWFAEQATNDFVSMRLVDSQGNIYAVNSDTVVSFTSDGKIRWTYSDSKFPLGMTMDYDGNIHFMASGELISLTYDGTLRWRFSIPDPFGGELVCDREGTVYVGAGFQTRTFYAIGSNGSVKWAVPLDSALDFSPCAAIDANGAIYAPAGSTTYGETWGVYGFR